MQRFLRDHVGEPAYPLGAMEPDQHLELALWAVRPERVDWDAVRTAYELPARDQVEERAHRWVESARSGGTDLVVSSEMLWHLRFADEVDRLLDLLADAGADRTEVVMVRRDPASLLPSFELAQVVTADTGLTNLDHDDGSGAWLVDVDGHIGLWSPRCEVRVFDYGDEVAKRGSIIPAVASLVGADPVEYWLNSSEWITAQIVAEMRRQQP